MKVERVRVRSILTRTGGYLAPVASHTLQPYRGCSYGASLCGVGCYVRSNPWVLRGREWGSFLEVRENAAEVYRKTVARERRWARRDRGRFTIFFSSSTDPFVPQERREGVSLGLLEAMAEEPPDELIVQTHSHLVLDTLAELRAVAARCALRVHLSIESDRDRLPGLPAPASSVAQRFEAAARLKDAGLRVVITVAPLLPLADPEAFFTRVASVSEACVLDHFIGGDGTADGRRTARTALPAAMAVVDPACVEIGYLDAMRSVAERVMPGRVAVGAEGFAGVFPSPVDPSPRTGPSHSGAKGAS